MLKFISKFLYLVSDRKNQLIFLICLFLFSSVLDTLGIGLIGPFMALVNDPQIIHKNLFLAWLYNNLKIESQSKFVAVFGIIIIAIFYVKSILSFRIQKKVFKFSYALKGDLAKRLLRGYLAAPYTFHLNKNTALLIQNILQETNNFCNGITLPLLNSISYLVILLCLGFLLIKTNVIATFSAFIILLVPLILYRSSKDKLARWGREASISQVGILRTINHSLGGFKETRIIGCESYFDEQISHYIQGFENAVSSSQTFKLLPRIVIEAILITFLVGFTSIALLMNENPQNLTPVLGIFAIASIRLIPAVSQITTGVASLRTYSYCLNKLYFDLKEIEGLPVTDQALSLSRDKQSNHSFLKSAIFGDLFAKQSQVIHSDFELTDTKEALASSSKSNIRYFASDEGTHRNDPHSLSRPVMSFKDRLVLSNVCYTYPKSESTSLNNISITIEKGKSIAFIGKSGAGKTTLVDVILGLLEPTRGDIQVDDISIYQNLRAWQNLVGYIPQSIFLMDDSIERNIAFGVPDDLIDPHKLEKAIKAAQLSELIDELPQGLKTFVGDKGVRLSGGQRQRVGIARALYHEREILILDEATAALDNETEKLVNDSINALSGQKNLIIVAHRLSTVERCDCLYRLEKGTIVQSGSYNELVLGQST